MTWRWPTADVPRARPAFARTITRIYYGAYFRDPDGNKLCVCCHQPEPD